jgi:hypothetical protein
VSPPRRRCRWLTLLAIQFPYARFFCFPAEKMVMYKASKDGRDLVVQIGGDSPQQSTINRTLAEK